MCDKIPSCNHTPEQKKVVEAFELLIKKKIEECKTPDGEELEALKSESLLDILGSLSDGSDSSNFSHKVGDTKNE
jgi:hypothetical protein